MSTLGEQSLVKGYSPGLTFHKQKDLTARFDISQPAVSQHLATLRSAGLVSERRDGRLVYYRVEPKGLRPLIDWIAHYQAFWLERLDRLQTLLEEMDE